MADRNCGTCRHFESANELGRGWCRNPRLFTANQSQPVFEDELFCRTENRDFWESADGLDGSVAQLAAPVRKPKRGYSRYQLETGDSSADLFDEVRMRASAGGPPESSGTGGERGYGDLSGSSQPSSPQRSGSFQTRGDYGPAGGSGQERPVSYQSEERYWTDYLRIALPIVGLLLLLSVFWYWASSFIGDDDDETPRTPEAAIINTPITAATLTPTLAEAIQITPQTINPTQAAGQQPTQQTAPQPTNTTAPSTDQNGGGEETSETFALDDLVVVNDEDVNMRSEPTTSGDIVDTLAQGTELRIIDSSSVVDDVEGYTWWNVEDPLNGTTGWVVEDFLDASTST
jgi:Bacterial SH3 domain